MCFYDIKNTMKNKVVLITGASNGIGAEMAKLFALKSFKVVINYNNSQENAINLANEICSIGQTAIAIKADVSSPNDISNMISETIQTFGHIDILINNAGICSNNLLIDEFEDNINKLISVNLTSTINCTKQVCKHMISNGTGKIINISSIWGLYGAASESVYSATKGGIIAFTKAMAKELAYSGITVNCIAPGVVDTKMMSNYSPSEIEDIKQQIPLGRFANPSEIAKLALFLASDDANYITGQILTIDGGFTL